MARPTFQSVRNHESAVEILFEGNVELVAGRPEQALRLYTQVLYDVSPGHVCAFLNRAMAYIALGYPDLGVMDAYRAAITCHELRDTKNHTLQLKSACREIRKYLLADTFHYVTEEPWTSPSDGHIGSGWLHTDLSRILLAPEIDFNQWDEIPWDALEIRAVFRMCGALFNCGRGARSDALGLISDVLASTKRLYDLTDRERWTFKALADDILKDCVTDISINEKLTKALMKTKTTLVHQVLYPWDTRVPEIGSLKDIQELKTYVDLAAGGCTVRITWPTSKKGLTFKLIAAHDVLFDEIVMTEESYLQVTTADPSAKQGFFCDSCAAVMLTSGDAQPKMSNETQHSWSSSGASIATTEPHNSSDYDESSSKEENAFKPPQSTGSTQLAAESTLNSSDIIGSSTSMEDNSESSDAEYDGVPLSQASSRPLTPPQHSKLDLTPDFHHCNACLAACFCSGDCLGSSGDYHITLCNSGLEQIIRSRCTQVVEQTKEDELSSADGSLHIHPKARCLYDLLFTRIVAMAVDKDVNPLDLPEIRWLNGDLRSAPESDKNTTAGADVDPILHQDEPGMDLMQQSRTLPWSFTNNVVNPIHYLQTMDIDPVRHLNRTDGWMLNTLFAKIMHSTQITKGARHAKVYDDIGKLVNEETPAPEPVDEDVWVGSIHPVSAMVEFADQAKGEKSNAVVEYGKGVKCIAPSRDESAEGTSEEDVEMGGGSGGSGEGQDTICIRAGEDVLRFSAFNKRTMTAGA
ncbi:hypothetical protein MMC34_008346 [Xylographa carneopallida]|nr:hypothetical protein [Xylographa carneopallida]